MENQQNFKLAVLFTIIQKYLVRIVFDSYNYLVYSTMNKKYAKFKTISISFILIAIYNIWYNYQKYSNRFYFY